MLQQVKIYIDQTLWVGSCHLVNTDVLLRTKFNTLVKYLAALKWVSWLVYLAYKHCQRIHQFTFFEWQKSSSFHLKSQNTFLFTIKRASFCKEKLNGKRAYLKIRPGRSCSQSASGEAAALGPKRSLLHCCPLLHWSLRPMQQNFFTFLLGTSVVPRFWQVNNCALRL